MRCYSTEALLDTMAPYLPITGFEPEEWLADHKNIALYNDKGDFALFEYETKGVYSGHYFFKSRGRGAVNSGKDFLRKAFTEGYGIEVIRGFSPLQHLGARWLNKQLGFTGYGVVNTEVGPMELVILTKKEWMNL